MFVVPNQYYNKYMTHIIKFSQAASHIRWFVNQYFTDKIHLHHQVFHTVWHSALPYYIQAHKKNSWLVQCRHTAWDGQLLSQIWNQDDRGRVSLKHRKLTIYWIQWLQRFKTFTFLANVQKKVNLANVKLSVLYILILCILEAIWQKAVQYKKQWHQTS